MEKPYFTPRRSVNAASFYEVWKISGTCNESVFRIFSVYPILLILFNFSSSISLILRPSMMMSFSAAKLDRVRMAFDVVMFDRLAKSSRER